MIQTKSEGRNQKSEVRSASHFALCTLQFALCIAVLAIAGCGTNPVVWKQVIDAGAPVEPAALAMTADGLVAVGTKTTSAKTAWLIQTLDKDGKLRWRRDYSQGEASVCSDVCTDATGDMFVCGTCKIKGSEMCVVVKYRPNGAVAWQKALSVGDASRARGIALSDSFIVVSGSVMDKQEQELLVAKLGPDGRTVWSKNFNFGPLDEGTRVAANAAGDLVVIGRAGTAENPDILLMRLNAKGDSVWTRRYDSGGEDEPGDVGFDVFGNVVATGTGRAGDSLRCVIIEYQPDGALIRKTAYGAQAQAAGKGLFLTPDGDIFVCATSRGLKQTEILAFQYKPNATAIWERTLSQANADLTASDVVCDKDVFVLGMVAPKAGQKNMLVARFARPVAPAPALPQR